MSETCHAAPQWGLQFRKDIQKVTFEVFSFIKAIDGSPIYLRARKALLAKTLAFILESKWTNMINLCLLTFKYWPTSIYIRFQNKQEPFATHHLCWDLLHLGSRSSGSRVKLVYEEAGEAVLPHQIHRLFKVLICFSWEPTDDVSGNGDTWNPINKKKT